MRLTRYLGLSLLLALAACHQAPVAPGMKLGKPYAVDGKTYYPAYDPTYDKIGVASWYGPGFHGKYTASGEVFDQNDLTAAHPTLPMPSIVRVTDLANGKTLIVRINDRGPFAGNRIIDLSKRAAHMLGISSTAQVRVQYLKKETDEYLASVKAGQPLDMAEINAESRRIESAAAEPPASSQIVESTDASSHAGQPIDEAAPVMTVSSDSLSGGTNLSDSSGRPVGNSMTARQQHAWADDNATLPDPPPAAKPRADAAGPVSAPVVLSTDVASNDTDTAARKPFPQPPQTQAANDDTNKQEAADAKKQEAAEAKQQEAADAKKQEADDSKEAASLAQKAPSSGGHFIIQAGSFIAKNNAQKLSSRLENIARTAVDRISMGGKTWWRVRLGPFNDREEANDALEKVRSNGSPDARLVHS